MQIIFQENNNVLCFGHSDKHNSKKMKTVIDIQIKTKALRVLKISLLSKNAVDKA